MAEETNQPPVVSSSETIEAGKNAGRPRNPLDILEVRDIARIEEGVPVTMRDGIQLFAIVITPTQYGSASKWPVILIQTPYVAEEELGWGKPLFAQLLREGYVIAIVNVRGSQWSEGEYRPLMGVANDGADTLKWVIQQPWSNQRVGALGCSSSGEVEYALAAQNPPGLKAFVPMAAGSGIGDVPGYTDKGMIFTGGVPNLVWPLWYRVAGGIYHPKLPRGISQEERVAQMHAFRSESLYEYTDDMGWAAYLPSADMLKVQGLPDSQWNKIITLKPSDRWWQHLDELKGADSTKVPGLHINSWYDSIDVDPTIKAFQHLSRRSSDQYLVIGPGQHCMQFTASQRDKVGDRPIGNDDFDYAGTIVKFLNHWVKDDDPGELRMSHIQYYPLESGEWISTDSWPPRSTPRRLYLSSNGQANSLSGNGRLKDAKPPAAEPADRFASDPMNPVPSHGGNVIGDVLDQTQIEKRADVLVYTTAPFTKHLKIAGEIRASLYVSSTARDTDLTLKLVDVYPDGRAYNVLDTIQRLRYREGIDHERLMEPGKVYRIDLANMSIASHFAPGHRIRIEIAGSNFPYFERNLNTGGNNFDESKGVVTTIEVHHDPQEASFIEIPVVP
jgi:hypothetical protein